MLSVRVNSLELNRILRNTGLYSQGFLKGIDMSKPIFMARLAEFVVDALGKYIDSQARANPSALHHVYEWGATGSQSARLFKMEGVGAASVITISGEFLPSRSVSDGSKEPFVDKANIMENRIGITISPRDSDVLVFEADGQTVFTRNSIYVASPGGDAVAGSFGKTVDMFFSQYFTQALLRPFLQDLETAEQYTNNFRAGTRGGHPVGVKAGQQYLNSAGVFLE
jgi:hypothetical protein